MTSIASPSQKVIDGCRNYSRYRRRQKFPRRSDCQKNHMRSTSTRLRSHKDGFHLVAILSITTLMLACSTIKDAPMLVNALFVQNTSNCRPHSAHWNTMMRKHHHIRQLPILPRRKTSPLSAKKGSNEKDEESSFSFFNRKDKDDGAKDAKDEDDSKSKDLPIVGRFFATEEEKEEKRRMKKEESEEKERLKKELKREKERLKVEAKKERQRRERESNKDYNAEDEKTNAVTGVKNYFRERQIRKDSEILRFQVMRREEERRKQLEKDAEELRLAVQQKEEERRKKMAKLKVPTAPLVAGESGFAPTEDIVRKKIQTQKEMDLARKERLEKIRAERGTGVPTRIAAEDAKQNKQQQSQQSIKPKDKNDSSSSKSQRLGGVVSAAQRFVSGVFSESEEWIVVAPKTRIAPGEIVAVTAAGIDLLLVAAKDGSAVHCVANSCPHLGTPLEIGNIERLPIESEQQQQQQQDNNNPKVQPKEKKEGSFFREKDIASMLKQDGCEDCIVCPLHKTAFALKSGEVRGEWCPYPPVIGKLTGAIKTQANLPVFDVRTKGKNIEVRLNTPVEIDDGSSSKKGKKDKR